MLHVIYVSFLLITARREGWHLQKLSNNYILFDAVICTWTKPFPGWIDNFNGKVGFKSASGKVFLRTVLADPNVTPDYMPVDICIQYMLLCAWCKAVGR